MKTSSYPRLASAALALWLLAIASLTAGQFGDFTYRVDGDQVTITDFPEDAVGHVEIPSKIDDKPVTALSTPPPRRPGGGHGHHGRTPATPPEYTFSPGAFANCRRITSISIPSGITRIGGGTFFNCAGLQHLELPPDLTELGGHAFAGCGVISLLIPAGVTSISEYAFSDCPALTSIHVEPENPVYLTIDGVLFDITATTLLQYPEGRAGAYTIPPGTTAVRGTGGLRRLPHGAFLNCTRLTGITIPSGATYIGSGAFHGCTGLQSIHVDEGNPSYTSVDGVLFDAEVSILIQFPARKGTTSDYIVPSAVSTIAVAAFSDCIDLRSVTIPVSVTTIGWDVFQGCTGLQSIHVDEGNPSYTSVDGVLFDAEMVSLVAYPAGKDGDYTIPVSVTTIGSNAFSDCTGLQSIHVGEGNPSYISVDGVLFDAEKTSLVAYPAGRAGGYTIPDSVTNIGWLAFAGATSLTRVTIPDSVNLIHGSAFKGCSALATAVLLGESPRLTQFIEFSRGAIVLTPVFEDVAPDFTIYFLSTSSGFTSPTWNGYPAVEIDVAQYPAAPWLLEQGLSHDTDLHQDLNGDGVSLLMAYALDLDPRENLHTRLPVPHIDGDHLAMSFYGSAPGISYSVQTSTDLQHWTTEGVTISDLDPGGLRTATVRRNIARRFLRLLVE